jgi:hypothetical protein
MQPLRGQPKQLTGRPAQSKERPSADHRASFSHRRTSELAGVRMMRTLREVADVDSIIESLEVTILRSITPRPMCNFLGRMVRVIGDLQPFLVCT